MDLQNVGFSFEGKLPPETLEMLARMRSNAQKREELQHRRVGKVSGALIDSIQSARQALAIALQEPAIPSNVLQGLLELIVEGESTLGDLLDGCSGIPFAEDCSDEN